MLKDPEPGERSETTAAGDAEAYFSTWTRSYGTATFIVTSDLRLIWANHSAQRLIAAGVDLRDLQGKLTFQDRESGPAFRAFLKGMAAEPRAWVCRRRQGGHFVFRAEAIQPEEGEKAFGVMVFDADPRQERVWADFGPVLGLTGAECRVIKLMIDGCDVEAVAAALSISVETVRTHIRNLYAKLGVRNREQLFSIILPFRVH